MNMDGFDVVPGELHAHAGAVADVASGVGDAASAGSTATAFTAESFGILCSFFTPPSIAASTIALEAIGSQRDMAQTLSRTLPKVADDYTATDGGVQGTMTGLEGQL